MSTKGLKPEEIVPKVWQLEVLTGLRAYSVKMQSDRSELLNIIITVGACMMGTGRRLTKSTETASEGK